MYGCVCVGVCVCWLCMHESVFVWCVCVAMPVPWCSSEPCLYHGFHHSHACTMVCMRRCVWGMCVCVCLCVCVCVRSHACTMVFIRAMPPS